MKAKIALFDDEIVISVEVISLEIKGLSTGKNRNIKTRFETEEAFNDIIRKKEPLLIISDIKITDLNRKLSKLGMTDGIVICEDELNCFIRYENNS